MITTYIGFSKHAATDEVYRAGKDTEQGTIFLKRLSPKEPHGRYNRWKLGAMHMGSDEGVRRVFEAALLEHPKGSCHTSTARTKVYRSIRILNYK